MDLVIILSRLIRLSSPNLNYIIGLGAIILYLNVITLVIPTTNTDFAAVLCNVSIVQIHCNNFLCLWIYIQLHYRSIPG